MSSVSSVNPLSSNLASLIQNLSQTVSPLVSSPKVETALENASPGDIARLSAAAVQLQGVDALFGTSDSNSVSNTTDPNSLFASLEQPPTDSNSLESSLLGSGLLGSSNNANTLLANLEQTLAASGSANNSTYSPSGLDLSQVQTLFGNSLNLLG
ncbi:MAG TPA: hypothetical protein VKG25_23055 [Bryobacteraceae bacterium]|nr:hypothetical protein [Bryobacteraceae bacterium]